MNRWPIALSPPSVPARNLRWLALLAALLGAVACLAQQTPSPAPRAGTVLTVPEGGAVPIGRPGLRQFPPTAMRGYLQVTAPPLVLLDGNPDQLSPGSRIRGPNNQLVMSGQLVGYKVTVNYTRTPQGQLHDVWILTALEAAQDIEGSGPRRNFRFESEASKGPRDDGKTPFDQLPSFQDLGKRN